MDFAQYWEATDFVSRSLFFILIALSVVSWLVGILRVISSSKLAKTVSDELSSKVLVYKDGLSELGFGERKTVIEQLLLQQIARVRFSAEKGLSILGTTAAIAPFIGLFGTVWGIFHALHAIGKTGNAGLAQVAAPVGEALIMTGLGLAVAIPAVVFFNIATRLNKKAVHIANDTAHQLLADSVR